MHVRIALYYKQRMVFNAYVGSIHHFRITYPPSPLPSLFHFSFPFSLLPSFLSLPLPSLPLPLPPSLPKSQVPTGRRRLVSLLLGLRNVLLSYLCRGVAPSPDGLVGLQWTAFHDDMEPGRSGEWNGDVDE